ncbi:hypothetical protein SLS62_000581 [Diatrype stigma]|uniref:Uncharacterized protein n=1 Tax=Diatrype stigma TaxID=117547 RepID=A0AAN9YUL0_9PEZI
MRWVAADGHTASHTEIEELFEGIVESIPGCVFIVDGLDECAGLDSDWKRDHRETLSGFLKSLTNAVIGGTSRVLVVSRNTQEIREGLGARRYGENSALNEIQIRPEDVKADATLFSQEIVNQRLANKSKAQREQLSSRMVDRCESMFLGIRMLEGDLSGGKNLKQLQRIIDQMPNGLEHIYDRNWERITNLPQSSRCRAFSILRWAAYGLRPITVVEITEALLLADEECDEPSYEELPDCVDDIYIRSEIIELCGSLVETRGEESNSDLGSLTIHLTHFSVRQYISCHMLTSTGQLIMNERLRLMNEAVENNTLAKTCLRYLNSQQVWEAQSQEQDIDDRIVGAFRAYASSSWYRHTKSNKASSEEVTRLINSFFRPGNERWELWRKDADAASKDPVLEYEGDITTGNPLFYASLLGFLDTMKYLVDELGLDVNYVDQSSRTALLAAASTGWVSGMSYLLEKGADVSVLFDEKKTAVFVAAHNGHIDVIRLLYKQGADLMAAGAQEFTPLHVASEKGHVEVVEFLLQEGVNPAAKDTGGYTPLYMASKQGQAQVVKRLLDRGADPKTAGKEGATPLWVASKRGHVETVQLLLEHGADPMAAEFGGWTPLDLAVHYHFYEVVNLLLGYGANPGTTIPNNGHTSLLLAARDGQREVIKQLLKYGADITQRDNTGHSPLHWAADRGQVEAVKMLLEYGADVTVPNEQGWTPLASAVFKGHTEVVKLFLEEGADFATPQNGFTLLWCACETGNVEIVNMFLEQGADLTAMSEGFTSLDVACRRGNTEVVKLLLERGADCMTASHGWLPLGIACHGGHTEVVRILLDKGAGPELTKENTLTALEMAREMGHQEVLKLLLEREADLETLCDGWESLSFDSNDRKVC